MKFLTLCADDYAQSPAITEGILRLLVAGRLDAVSCLALSPTWPEDAPKLREISGNHEVGLHFNLTLPFGQPPQRISTVLAAAVFGVTDREEILHRFDAQWNAFESHYGEPPAFVDGHQHVHVFPGIAEVIVARAQQLNPACWIRSLRTHSPPVCMKERFLTRIARPPQAATNPWFAGFRPYRAGFDFAAYFRNLLHHCPDGTLVMCHPGIAAEDPADPIAACRPAEFDYLISDSFARDCRSAGVVFRPFGKSDSTAFQPPQRLPSLVGVDMLDS